MIYGVMPIKDEADRYLADALQNVLATVDELFCFDDQSSDESYDIAWELTPHLSKRSDGTPSFLEHEGRFRQACWEAFEADCGPQPGDWILAIDADEALVTTWESDDPGDVYAALRREIERAKHVTSVVLPIPEVFGWSGPLPLVRKDRLWGTIAGTRLFTYQPGGRFADRPMASGSEPSYVAMSHKQPATELALMHFGYADAVDQVAKYERYSSLADHGHLDAHVSSIVAEDKVLECWRGMVPTMRKGSDVS